LRGVCGGAPGEWVGLVMNGACVAEQGCERETRRRRIAPRARCGLANSSVCVREGRRGAGGGGKGWGGERHGRLRRGYDA
jgi:hypothetical protein